MKNYSVTVGIDVSKSKLDVRFILKTAGKDHPHLVVSNNEQGIKQILDFLTKKKIPKKEALFCFENTGLYSMPLAIFLNKKNIDYWEIPAIEIKKSKGIARGKNDKNDAKDIAFYAISNNHKLKLSQLPEEVILKLQLLYSEREKVLKAKIALETTSEATRFLPKEVTQKVMEINKQTVLKLKDSLQMVEAEIMRLIKSDEQMNKNYKLATSVVGVGQQNAVYLLIKTKCFTKFANWRKFACFSGVAPFEYSSGSSIRGKTKVSHFADKKMKSLLNMSAMVAISHDKEIAEYYSRKLAEGKNPMLVLNAVRCKILCRVFAVINRQTPFVNTRKFAA